MVKPNNDSTDQGWIYRDLIGIESAIAAAMDSPVHQLSREDLLGRASRIQQIKCRLAALSARASTQMLAADSFATVRSAVTRLSARTGHDPKEVRRKLRINRWLPDFSSFAEAFAGGRLTLEHLRVLKGLDSVTTRHRLVESQEFFIDTAARVSFVEFRSVATYWANAADPDGQEPLYAEARSGCSYRQNSDGSISGKFYLDAVSAGAFKTAFEGRREVLMRSDAEREERRSQWQLGAASLLSLLADGHRSGSRAIVPLVSIVMGVDVAANALERLLDPSVPVVDPSRDDVNRRCELIDGTPIHPSQAIMAMIMGRFQRIVFDAKNRETEVSVAARGFPAWMRHILLIRSRGRCSIPACDSPGPWLQADHVRAFSRGGPTRLSNGQMLCRPHNRAKRAG